MDDFTKKEYLDVENVLTSLLGRPISLESTHMMFNLQVEHKVNLTFMDDFGVSTYIEGDVQGIHHDFCDHASERVAVVFAIAHAVVRKMELEKANA